MHKQVFSIMFRPLCEYDYECFKKYGRVHYDHSMFGNTMLISSELEMIQRILVKDHMLFDRLTFLCLPRFIKKGRF